MKNMIVIIEKNQRDIFPIGLVTGNLDQFESEQKQEFFGGISDVLVALDEKR